MDKEKLVVYFAIALLIISVLQSSFIVYKSIEGPTPVSVTAQATQGSLNLCLNHRPELSFPCNTTIRQGFHYQCQLNGSDYDGDAFTFSSINISGKLQLNVSPSGLINTSQITQDMVGNSSLRFMVSDDSGCQVSTREKIVDFTVLNKNDAPVFIPPMGPFDVDIDGSVRGIFLQNFFYDPDGDSMTFSYSTPPSGFLVTLTENNEIIISVTECVEGSILFEATDIYNASGYSTPVDLRASCYKEETSSSSGGGSLSGDCTPEWFCYDWERCRINNSQRRKCIDKNGCGQDYERYFWKNCTYIPQCENGVRDENEDDVDCGGPCPACQTCEDGLLNNGELEIDCGGPNCPACKNCFDGIQNYGEQGVDCGGPCPACPSCFDGIQNQNETGVDCGGPCAACTELETPLPITPSKSSPLLMISLAIISGLAGLLIIYRLFHKQIYLLFTKLWWLFMRHFAKQFLLSEKQKNVLLEKIALLEKKNLLASANKSNFLLFQEELSFIIRELFVFLIGKQASLPEDAHIALDHIKTTRRVKSLLHRHFNQLIWLEQRKILPLTDLQIQLELCRQRIFSISNVSREDVSRNVKEMRLVKQPARMRLKQLIYNSILALQFGQVGLAKEKYLQALEIYEAKISPLQQSEVYDLLRLVFNEISYVASYTKKKNF